jgi:hypothetical protein
MLHPDRTQRMDSCTHLSERKPTPPGASPLAAPVQLISPSCQRHAVAPHQPTCTSSKPPVETRQLDGLPILRKTLLIVVATSLILIGVLHLIRRLFLPAASCAWSGSLQHSTCTELERDDEWEAPDRIAVDAAT